MEKHFLQDLMEGEPEFTPEPWYNPVGDCIIYKMADEAVVADRVDELLTIYRSAVDQRPIGFKIKDVQAIIRRFGLQGLAVSSEADVQSVKSISVAVVLLAAYEEGRPSVSRRKAYASVMCPAEKTISAEDLQPV